jgi:BESS motif
MDFLLPFIDETKNILAIRKVKPVIKQQSSPQQTTVTLLQPKRIKPEEETILYTSAPANTITYSVQTVATSKDSSSQEAKNEAHQQTQDIQQFYNHAGVKIIGEDYITTYQPGGEQLIYQTSGSTVEEIQQQQQQECMQHEVDPNDSVNQDSKQQLTNATIIPIPNVSNVFSSTNPNEASDLYFLIGLLPDFRNLSHDTKRKVKMGMLKLLDDAVSQ